MYLICARFTPVVEGSLRSEKQTPGQGGTGRDISARPTVDDPWSTDPPHWLDAPARPGASQAHRFLINWLLLAAGMVTILLLALQDADLPPEPCTVLVVATVGLAGLCAWIINWGRRAQTDALRGRGGSPRRF